MRHPLSSLREVNFLQASVAVFEVFALPAVLLAVDPGRFHALQLAFRFVKERLPLIHFRVVPVRQRVFPRRNRRVFGGTFASHWTPLARPVSAGLTPKRHPARRRPERRTGRESSRRECTDPGPLAGRTDLSTRPKRKFARRNYWSPARGYRPRRRG